MGRASNSFRKVFMRLDDEQIRLVKDCLRKAGLEWREVAFSELVCRLEFAMDTFLEEKKEHGHRTTFRGAHDELRRLWLLADEADYSIGQIRERIQKLSDQAMKELDRFAPDVISPRIERRPARAQPAAPR